MARKLLKTPVEIRAPRPVPSNHPPPRAYERPLDVKGVIRGDVPLKIRVIYGHPMTGLNRAEWWMARYSLTIPCNWSQCDVYQFMSPFVPIQFQVADAQNLIVKTVVENDAEWLLMYEHDNLPPADAIVKLNEYMLEMKWPVVAGLYFTKSDPPEPMVYRGYGNSYYDDWKLGDKVQVSGVPMGFTLIHGSILKAMWAAAPEYIINNQFGRHIVRRVFDAPATNYADPNKGVYIGSSGSSDLAWCERVVREGFFEKAGWPDHQKMQYPFLMDTSIFVKHIDERGVQWPTYIPKKFQPNK